MKPTGPIRSICEECLNQVRWSQIAANAQGELRMPVPREDLLANQAPFGGTSASLQRLQALTESSMPGPSNQLHSLRRLGLE